MELLLLLFLFFQTILAFDPPSVFPSSTRQALATKSSQINPSSRYTSAGWSNRAATVVTPQCPGIYTADRPFYWNKIDVGCRSTIIELPSSSSSTLPDLFVHSPVGIDGPMLDVLSKLGTVKYVVSPNYEHVKFAPQWGQTFPDAEMWACPGLAERMPEVKWTGEVPEGVRPKGFNKGSSSDDSVLTWDTDLIQPLHLNIEVNPFTGKPFFNEVIYYHAPTRTLLVTDLFWNYPESPIPNSEYGRNDQWELAPVVDEIPIGSRLWKFGMDKVYQPFYKQFMVKDKDEFRAISNHILNVWQVETLIPAHGDILRGKEFIRDVLQKHLQL